MTQQNIKVQQGDVIFRENEEGDSMYVVVEGKVQIVKDTAGEQVVLASFEPGAFFGEMAIVEGTQRTATAVALTDTVLMPIHASELEQMLEQRPGLGAKMIHSLVKRLIHTTNQVVDEKEKIALLFSEKFNT